MPIKYSSSIQRNSLVQKLELEVDIVIQWETSIDDKWPIADPKIDFLVISIVHC